MGWLNYMAVCKKVATSKVATTRAPSKTLVKSTKDQVKIDANTCAFNAYKDDPCTFCKLLGGMPGNKA